MKLLHVAPSLNRIFGGPVYSLAAFARAAMIAGIDTTIVGPAAPEKEMDWIRSELPGVPIRSFTTFGTDAFIFSPALWLWLSRHVSDFDIVHIHGLLNPVSSLAARIAIQKKVPVVIHPFGTLSKYTFLHRRGLLKHLYFRMLDRPNLLRAGAIHFTTYSEQDQSKWHNVDWGNRGVVVPPPWIGGEPSSLPSLDLAGSNVLLMARLHPVKNVEALFDAWPYVLRQVPSARLTIAGDGKADYVRRLRQHAATLGPDARIVFRGFVREREKAQLLNESDVFVLPSYHENFGVVVLEALAARIPVVITEEVQLCSFVRNHALGRIVPRDPEAIAEGIIGAMRDSELRKRCSDEGPRLVAEYFAPSSIGNRLRTMYEAAQENTRAGQPT